MKRLALAVAFVCAAVPATAVANLPRAHSTRIVPSGSIGGVRLDMTKAQVFGKWGSTSHCANGVCQWQPPGGPVRHEVALVSFQNGKAILISIKAAQTRSGAFKSGTLSDWETTKGIHLGSPKSKVARAYGNGPGILRTNNSTGVGGFDYFLGVGANRSAGPNTTLMRFSTPGIGASKNLLWGISLTWACRPGPCQPIPQ
jgi:hypothetical protein